MKTVQEGTLADAFKLTLDAASTIALYVSYEPLEESKQTVLKVHETLGMDLYDLHNTISDQGSDVMFVAFTTEEPMDKLVATLHSLVVGAEQHIVFVSPESTIVEAVRNSLNDKS